MKRTEDRKSPETAASSYLADIMAIQSEMLRNLPSARLGSPKELGAMLEDFGNRYLDIAEAIRQEILNNQKRQSARLTAAEPETRAQQARRPKRKG